MENNNFEILLKAVMDSKSEGSIKDSIKKLNETIGALTIKIDPSSIKAIGDAMKDAIKEIRVVNETIVKEYKDAKDKIEKDKIEFVDVKLTKKQMEAVSKEVENTFKNLNISTKNVTKEAYSGLANYYAKEMFTNIKPTNESIQKTIDLLDKLAKESKVNISDVKKQTLDTQRAMGQQYTDVYKALLNLKDGKKNFKLNFTDEISGIEGFKESMRGILTVVESGGVSLDELQREMVSAGVVAKDVGEKHLQDFAQYLQECVVQSRELSKLNMNNVKIEMPSFENNIMKELIDGKQNIALAMRDMANDVVKEFDKIGELDTTKTFSVMTEDGKELLKVVETYKDGMGKVQTITKLVEKDSQQLLDVTEQISYSKEKEEEILRRISEFAQRNKIDEQELLGLREKEITRLEQQEKLIENIGKKSQSISDRTSNLMQGSVGFNEDKQANSIITQTNQIKKAQQEMQKLVQSGKAVSQSELDNLQKQIAIQERQLTIFDRKYQRIAEVNKLEQKSSDDNQRKIQFYTQQQKYLDDAYNKLIKIGESKFYDGQEIDLTSFEKLESLVDSLLLNNQKLTQEQKTSLAEMKYELDKYISSQEQVIANNRAMADSIDKAHAEANKFAQALVQIDGKKSSLNMSVDGKDFDGDKLDDLNRAYDELATKLKTSSISTEQFRLEMSKLDNQSKEFKSTVKGLAKETNTFSDSMKRFSAMYGMYELFQMVTRAGRDMVDTIVELDEALVEVNKVAEIPNMDKFIEQSYNLGETIGVTGKNIIDGVGEFARMGKTIDESLDLSQVANEMTIVGDGISSVSEASGVLQSALALFEKDGYTARNVLDLINQTANKTGATFEAVAEIVKRSSTLGLSGSSLEEIIALGSALFEVTRNAEASATALNMINQRLMGLDDEGEYSVELVSTLGKELMKLTGVDVFDVDGNLRPTFDILKDINGVWEDLDKNVQIATSTLVGNNRHAKSFIAIMENFDTVNKSIAESSVAQGSSQKELEAYMNSLNGALTELQSAWEKLTVTTVNSNLVEGIVRATTAMVKLIDACGGLIPVLTAILGIIVAIKSAKIESFLMGAIQSLQLGGMALVDLAKGASLASVGMSSLAGGIGIAITAISGIVMALNWLSKSEERAQQKLAELKDELLAMDNTTAQIDNLAKSFDGLSDKMRNDEEESQFKQIQNELKELLPDLRGYYDESGNFIITEREQIDELIDGYKQLSEVKRQTLDDASSKATSKAIEDIEEYKRGIAEYQRELESLQNSAVNGEMAEGAEIRIAYLQKAIEDLSKSSADSIKIVKQSVQENIEKMEEWGEMSQEQKSNIVNAISDLGFGQLKTLIEGTTSTWKHFIDSTKDIDPTPLSQWEERCKAVSEETSRMNEATAEMSKLMEDTIESVSMLNEAIYAMEQGQALSKQQVDQLIEAYPQLIDQLIETDKGYQINIETLKALKGESEETFTSMQQDQINATNKAIEEAQSRINMYRTEMEALRLLRQAQSLAKESNPLYTSNIPDIMTGGKLNQLEKQAEAEDAYIKSLQDRLDNIGRDSKIYDFKTSPSKGSKKSSSGKKGKSAEQQIKEELEKALKAIQSNREKIDREIALLKEKINLEDLKGMDTTKLDADMAKLLELRKQATEVENQQYRTLQKKYKDTASQATLEKLIADNSKTWFSDRMNMLNQETDALEEKLELTQRYYELDEEELNKQIEREGLSEKSIELENQKLEKIKNVQQELTNFLTHLNDAKYGEESKLVQKYTDLWQEYEDKRIEQELKTLQMSYDIEMRRLDQAKKMRDLHQMLVKEDSDEWWKYEEENANAIIETQELIAKQMQAYRDAGLSETSEEIQELTELWFKYEQDRLSMALKFAEKRRQAELDSLKKQQKEMQDSLKGLEDGQKTINDLIDLTMDMIKKEMELKKKAINEEIDGYKKIIDEKKNSLRKDKEEKDFKKSMEEKLSQQEKLEKKIAQLSKDNSAKATAEKLKLEEELSKLKDEINSDYEDKKIQEQEEALDDEFNRFQEKKQKELDEIEDFLSKEGKLREEAIKLIESKNKDLYNKLMKYNEEYGNKTRKEVQEIWDNCYKTLEHFNSGQIDVYDTLGNIVDRMKELQDELKSVAKLMDKVNESGASDYLDGGVSVGKPPTGGSNNNPSDGKYDNLTDKEEKAKYRDKQLEKMIELGDEMRETSDTKRIKELKSQQESIAKTIGAYNQAGTWYIMINSKKYRVRDAVGVRHNGIDYKDPKTGSPFVGGRALLKSNEEFNKLLHGELVVNSEQMDTYMRKILPSQLLEASGSGSVQIEKVVEITIEGNATDGVVDKLRDLAEEISDLAISKINKITTDRGISRSVKSMSV